MLMCINVNILDVNDFVMSSRIYLFIDDIIRFYLIIETLYQNIFGMFKMIYSSKYLYYYDIIFVYARFVIVFFLFTALNLSFITQQISIYSML